MARQLRVSLPVTVIYGGSKKNSLLGKLTTLIVVNLISIVKTATMSQHREVLPTWKLQINANWMPFPCEITMLLWQLINVNGTISFLPSEFRTLESINFSLSHLVVKVGRNGEIFYYHFLFCLRKYVTHFKNFLLHTYLFGVKS